MSDKNRDDFWRELMGDESGPSADVGSDDNERENSGDLGFKIEYLSRDGEKIGESEPEHPVHPAQPQEDVKIYPSVGEKTAKPHPEAERPDDGNVERQVLRPARREAPFDFDKFDDGQPPVRPAQERGGTEQNIGRGSDPADDFEVDFDFDKEYEDVEEKPVKRGRTKRTGCLGGIMMFLFIVCVSAVLACLGWMAATDVLGLGNQEGIVEVTIPKDIFTQEDRQIENDDGSITETTVDLADIDAVADILKEQGLIKYKWLFKLYSSFSHADEKIKSGTYQLEYNYDYRALVNGMTPAGGKRVEIDITVPEGYTITQIVNLLAENNVCDRVELLDALANYDFDYDFLDSSTLGQQKRLEGYLFPDTYTFYVGDSPTRVISKFLDNFDNKWTDEFSQKAQELGYSMKDILTVASMVEKEAGSNDERADIASVIYNRLENPGVQGTVGLLQIDATIYYAIEDTGEAFSTSIDSPYNTYLHEGLTPGPICNPGLASIEAAIEHADTDYYYYALNLEGTHEFFTSYSGFENFINSDQYGG